ncbi:MAG: SusC/RagA family TonB-linked outer membrane protein [Saprospiraceae bacterium]|nr:SusC/RagA family TonB-linked outer membrane protein [Saprospiraceae bacterium]MDP4998023.1 SusC/RagA family TonB-linked outer membrane protein [Saprospiraceae bacterium]
MKRSLLMLSFAMLFAGIVAAQSTVTGTVTDKGGEPLIGASILVKGTSTGAVTDLDGTFDIEVGSDADVLVVSYTGYATQEVAVGGRSNLTIALESDAAMLDEIVVTGVSVGTSTRKLGFTVGKVSERQISETPGVNAATALQGKVAGAQVVAASGLPGSSPSIRLRGSTSLVNSSGAQQPLIIIDGVQLAGSGSLADINSEDIQTIEVVKGAAASSLYGSRAANGVINIITKRGASDQGKTEITFRTEYGNSFQQRQIPLATHHAYEMNPDGSVNYSKLAADQIADNEYSRIFDQQQRAFDPGSFVTNTLNIASRSASTNFFFSLNNTDQDGIVALARGYQRQSVRANIDHKISNKIKLSVSNYYMQSTQNDIPAGNPFYSLLFMPPDVDIFAPNEEDGSLYNWNIGEPASLERNPLYMLANQNVFDDTERFTGNYALSYDITPFLKAEGSYSMDRRQTSREYYIDKGYLSDDVSGVADGYLYYSSGKNTYQTASAKLTFNKKFGKTNVVAQTFYLFEDEDYSGFSVAGYDFRFAGLKTINNSFKTTPSSPDEVPENRTAGGSSTYQIRSENIYLTGAIDYDDKIIADGLIRRDGSSLFGANNRWNTFYRGSLAYRISEDLRLPNVQELKVRVSYGTAGNRPGFSYRFETFTNSGAKAGLGNENLKSSLTKELEFGIDGRLFNKFNFNLSYANSKSVDQFWNVTLPAAAGGFSSQWQNIDSELEADVFEATLGYDFIVKDDLEFTANLVFDRIVQNLNKFDFPDFRIGPGAAFVLRSGERFGTMYGEKFARSVDELSQAQRDADTYVVNSDGYVVRQSTVGTVNEAPVKVRDENGNTLFVIGDINPDFNMGINFNFRYKGFRAYALFNLKQGGDVYNNTSQWILRELRGGQVDQSAKPADERLPVGYYATLYNVNAVTNHFVEDGSFLKLRELSVSYALGQKQLGNAYKFLKGATISVVGRNLFTLTNYSGYDPEVASSGDATNYMFDGFGYPNFSTITGRIELKF